jgi:hypothetical protein
VNGPEHYREAERLLWVANDRHADGDGEGAAIFTQQAQVHATLALVAANAPGAQRCAQWTDIVRPGEQGATAQSVEEIAEVTTRMHAAEGRADRLQEKVAGLETRLHLQGDE